jgi:hypothetical protein
MRMLAGILIATVVIFGALEIGRWQQQEYADILSPVQKIRRTIGFCLFLVIGAMIYAGTYWPQPIIAPPIIRLLELFYWTFFILITGFVLLINSLEFKDSLKRGSQLRKETFRSVLAARLDQLPNDGNTPKKPSD